MSPAVIAILTLIAKYGPALAESIYRIVTSHAEPTPEMWAALKAAVESNRLEDKLKDAGIITPSE